VENLAVVSCQNELPASETDLPETRGRLEASTKDLVKAAEDAGALIAIAFGDDQDLEVQPDDEERALWAAARFDAPRFVTPDMERGRSLGTAARSHAFLGSLDEALTLAFRARSLFWGSAFDLTFNASVIARIELERARLGDGKTDLIGAALTAAGVNAIRKTARLRDALSKADGSIRFVFDLVLRALLWAPEATGAAVETWLGALNDDRLYELLATGSMRSHPTELVARHAAELLTRHGNTGAAERWFQLSIALSDAAGETSTIRRLGVFTRRLYDGSGATGSLASSTNPRFEYR
jgi:hypothetical protein